MNVLIIHCSYKYRGGEDTVVCEEMRILEKAGIRVDLLEFQNDKRSLLKLIQMPFNFSSYWQTCKKIDRFKPDIVHIHNLHFAGSASVLYALKHKRVPFVTTLHNYRLLCPSAILFNDGQLYLKSVKQIFPWDAIRKGVYKNSKLLTFWVSITTKLHQCLGTWQLCSKYIVLTEHAQKVYLESKLGLGENKLIIKPNFCALPSVTPTSRSEHFLYVGRLTEEKGVRLLLQVFSSNSYRLKIAGDGPLRQEVMQYSEKYDNIEFLDIVKKDDLPDLLASCTALIFPSIWFEGMPLTIIEAFATGTPVIASKLGAMESMIENDFNGLHFEAGCPRALGAKLALWHNMNSLKKATFYKNAQATYKHHYTPEENLEKLLSIYQSVIDEKNTVA
ncbi:glycosyltransferase [Flavisolibacter sp. BT320]|nr:glycosyltransferase [Flavisolibacter longurius]